LLSSLLFRVVVRANFHSRPLLVALPIWHANAPRHAVRGDLSWSVFGAHAATRARPGGRSMSRPYAALSRPAGMSVSDRISAILAERRVPMCGRISRMISAATGPCTRAAQVALFGALLRVSRTWVPKRLA